MNAAEARDLYRREKRRRAKRIAPLIEQAKREFTADQERWLKSRRSIRTPRGVRRSEP